MKSKEIILDNEESAVLKGLEADTWLDDTLSDDELNSYKKSAKYTKYLSELEEFKTIEYIESQKPKSINNLSDIIAKIKSAVAKKYDKN
jgi:hypothetical protein